MQQRAPLSTVATDPGRLAHVRTLLARYPDTTPEENEEVIIFLRKGPTMDRALLTGCEHVQRGLSQFTADHKHAFSFSATDWLITAAIVLAIIASMLFLWDFAA